jgi:hypothetical protein
MDSWTCCACWLEREGAGGKAVLRVSFILMLTGEQSTSAGPLLIGLVRLEHAVPGELVQVHVVQVPALVVPASPVERRAQPVLAGQRQVLNRRRGRALAGQRQPGVHLPQDVREPERPQQFLHDYNHRVLPSVLPSALPSALPCIMRSLSYRWELSSSTPSNSHL